MNTQTSTEWLTSQQAANYLSVNPRTLLAWARRGHIKGYILSGTSRITWRFLRSDLDATLSSASRALYNGRIE